MAGAYRRTEKATITVYLSLILLLLLSLICTVIEGARLNTAGVFAKRTLSTSTDSVLADYYGPLWKEYHLFGYDAGEGGTEEKADRMEEALADYMSYTLTPGKDLSPEQRKGKLDLLGVSLDSVEVQEQTRQMDYQGELLINEAVSYMKYDMAADGLEAFLNKLSLLQTPKKVSAVYEKKLKAEEKLAETDRNVLKLMELFDGLRTSRKGLKLDKKGKLQINDYFIKMLYTGTVTADAVAINNESVFREVKEHYSNPAGAITVAKQHLTELQEIAQQIKELGEAIQSYTNQLSDTQAQLEKIGDGKELSGEEKKQASEISQAIEGLQETGSSLLSEQEELMSRKQGLIESVSAECRSLETVFDQILPLLREAEVIIGRITNDASLARPIIEEYEKQLLGEKDSLGEDLFGELSENLQQMKEYTDVQGEYTAYSAMKGILEENRKILLKGIPLLKQCKSDLKEENYSSCITLLDSLQGQLKEYHVTELSLDYSTLVMEKTKTEDPIGAVNDLMKNSLTSLVIDPETISEYKLSGDRLPSREAELLMQDTGTGVAITDFIARFAADGYTAGMQDLFRRFSDSDSVLEMLSNELNKASEQLLFREYLKEQFESYPFDRDELTKRKPAALLYEQEYLLYGRTADRENLSSVVEKLIFLRMMMDFVTLLRDPVRMEEALAAATALVGFTGFPVLISITKTVILLVWAFAEALTDVCALMQGLEVPIIKKSIMLTLPEMLLLNRNYLQSKVQGMEKSKPAFSYRNYLQLFLLLKQKEELAYHSMDLIQENINLRYEEEFYFDNCLYGFRAKAEFSAGTKFLAIPVIRSYLKHSVKGWRFQFQTENSY